MLDDPRYILGGGGGTSVAFGAFLELLLIIANIGTAVVLFPILKRQNEIARLSAMSRLDVVECTFIAVGILSLLAVVTLRQEAGAGADAASLLTTGEFFWELSLGIWPIVRGFNPSAVARLEHESQ